jgi:hypothetical protein
MGESGLKAGRSKGEEGEIGECVTVGVRVSVGGSGLGKGMGGEFMSTAWEISAERW